MPAVTTEGIILKRVNFGEADRVLTIITNRFGKISVTARGVRKITSRRAGNIEVLNRVRLHLFKAKGYSLSEAESMDTFEKIKLNLTLCGYAFHILELVHKLTAEDQKNSQVYQLTLEILKILEVSPRQIYIRAFEVKLLSLLGFWGVEGIGGLHQSTKDILKKLQFGSWEEIGKIKLKAQQAMELEKILRYYVERIIEGKLKSIQVLKRL